MVDNIRKLEIELERTVWYAGETLIGQVNLEVLENTKIRGIRVHLRGKGHTEWKVTSSGQQHCVKDEEVYIDTKCTVWGMDKVMELDGNDALAILARGHHSWQFRFQLPETGMAPSFESRHCRIRYNIRCIVDIPFASNPSHMMFFTVVSPHADCMQASHLSPTKLEIASPKCLLMPCSEPVKLSCTLERSAYCCGEYIKLKCLVANGTIKPLRICVTLLQDCCFYISRSGLELSKEFQHIAFEFRSDQIAERSNVDWDLSRFLCLPPMPPTIPHRFCKLISITYTLRVHLFRNNLQASSNSICLDFPFTIATLPFRIPHVAVPPLSFQSAVESVEGGMYISPMFSLGQVYDGSESAESGLLYQPVYPTVSKNPAKLQRQRVASIVSSLADCAEKVSSV